MTAPLLPKGDQRADCMWAWIVSSLVCAELLRVGHTRIVRTVLAAGAAAAVAFQLAQAVLMRRPGDSITPGLVTTGLDVAGFALLVAAGIGGGRDYGSGAINLRRLATPQPRRRLCAGYLAYATTAAALTLAVMLVGLCILAASNPAALKHPAVLFELGARSVISSGLLACAGIGLGVLTRSNTGAVFLALTLYWLLPIGLLFAGISGSTGAANIAEATLSLLASHATGPEVGPGWRAVLGIAVWTATITALAALRETKGK